MSELPSRGGEHEIVDRLAMLERWSEEAALEGHTLPASPDAIRRFKEIADELGLTIEQVVSRALAALEAQSTR